MRRPIVTLSRPIESDFAFNEAECNFVIDLQCSDAISRCTGDTGKRHGKPQKWDRAFPSAVEFRQRKLYRRRLTARNDISHLGLVKLTSHCGSVQLIFLSSLKVSTNKWRFVAFQPREDDI